LSQLDKQSVRGVVDEILSQRRGAGNPGTGIAASGAGSEAAHTPFPSSSTGSPPITTTH